MKYTIEGFSQEYAMKLKKHIEKRNKIVEIKIDCTDLVILRWFVDFYPKMKKYIIDNKEYAWLTHNKLLEDLPLIDISRGAFIERMQKLVEFGILEYRFVKKGGTYSLYAFGENYNNLIESKEGAGSNTYGVQSQTYTVVCVQTDNKNNSINDNSINNNIYTEIINYLNEKAGTNYRASSKATQSHINARLREKYTIEDFKKVIDIKVSKWKDDVKMCEFLRPETLFGNKFESYLNEKQVKQSTQNYTNRDYSKTEVETLYTNLDNIDL